MKNPVGRQVATPRRPGKPTPGSAAASAAKPAADAAGLTPGLPLPHERDESTQSTAKAPDPVMAQAKRDIDSGQVDTDMRATPGLDAERRAELVPGPSSQPPGKQAAQTRKAEQDAGGAKARKRR